MIKDVELEIYRNHFQSDLSPYTKKWFISLVKNKADEVLHLMRSSDKSIGLVVGLKNKELFSPFSAPFGGFHYSHEHLMYDSVLRFVNSLQDYIVNNNLKGIRITLPPEIYQTNMNAKFANAFIKSNYELSYPNLVNWVDLYSFDGKWVYNKVTNRCRKALSNGLIFKQAFNLIEKEECYNLIKKNRLGQGRQIHMSFQDLLEINKNIDVDFLLIKDKEDIAIGAGILYRDRSDIIQAIFMGDDLNKRDLGAIDFLYLNIYNHYKQLGYKYIDFGTSSLNGEPNIGLLRFKEIHNCNTSLQYSFSWTP